MPIKIFGFIFLLALSGFTVSAQRVFKFINGNKPQKIRFEQHRNLVIVQAKLNGKGPYNFLLDTGVSTSLITDARLIDSLGLMRGEELAIAGMGAGSDLKAFFSRGVKVEMSGIMAEKMTFAVLSEDVLKLGNYIGEPVHGIIGFDFFNSFVMEFNFNLLTLTLYPPNQFKPNAKWQKIPLLIEENKPYFISEISNGKEVLPVKLIIDTGAGHALSLEINSNKQLKIPERNLPTQLGVGLSGPVHGCIGRVEHLKFGAYHLKQLLASFPDSLSGTSKVTVKRNGNLGMELLKRFKVVFDYQGGSFYLKKHDNLKKPFEYDMCGLEIAATAPYYRTYHVTNVHEDSPAFFAGMLPGDELLAIDMKPATAYSLTQISRMFHSQNGREIDMLLKRKGELLHFKIKLKRRI